MRLWNALGKSQTTQAHLVEVGPNGPREVARFTVGEYDDLMQCRYYNYVTGEMITGGYSRLIQCMRNDGAGAGRNDWIPD